jgi:hypothetical protein
MAYFLSAPIDASQDICTYSSLTPIPEVIRTDNGAPFASAGLAGLSSLSVWWLKLGIELERIEPGHPEQNGVHERFHRTLKRSHAQSPRSTLHTQQKAFDTFCREFNRERPHEGLNQNPPARVYEPSRRDFPSRLLEPEYAEHWVKRRVRSNGEIKWEGAKLYVSQALVGEWVGLEPVAERVWKVHFMNQTLGATPLGPPLTCGKSVTHVLRRKCYLCSCTFSRR